jgi:hypothetical protein
VIGLIICAGLYLYEVIGNGYGSDDFLNIPFWGKTYGTG